MTTLQIDNGLAVEVIDLVPPWSGPVETVLFSAGLGTDRHIWSGWIPRLAARYRLVRYDLRGFGASTVPGGWKWTLDTLADDIVRVADATDSRRFHLVGEALSGTVCLHLAGRADGRARLASVTTCNSPYRGGSLENVARWRALITEGGVPAWSARMMAQRFHGDEVEPDALRWFAALQAKSSADALLGLGDVLLTTELSAVLPTLPMPALLMCGDDSPYVSVATAAAMRDMIPGAEMHVFSHARHGLPFSHAPQCAEVLLGFLARRCGR